MVSMGTFRFVTLILRNLPMEITEIIGIYIIQMVLTNVRIVFWGQSPVFSILVNIFDHIWNWQLTYC